MLIIRLVGVDPLEAMVRRRDMTVAPTVAPTCPLASIWAGSVWLRLPTSPSFVHPGTGVGWGIGSQAGWDHVAGCGSYRRGDEPAPCQWCWRRSKFVWAYIGIALKHRATPTVGVTAGALAGLCRRGSSVCTVAPPSGRGPLASCGRVQSEAVESARSPVSGSALSVVTLVPLPDRRTAGWVRGY